MNFKSFFLNVPIADWSITIRKLLMILDELKLLNGKLLTAKEVVEIMATENPIVYDSENCYNLELEVGIPDFYIICFLIIKFFFKYTNKIDNILGVF